MSNLREALRSTIRRTAAFENLSGLRHRQTSYSQFGEDCHILSFYNRLLFDRRIKIENPCFVDIGCCRPITWSNSYAFHRQGWKCINVDATPGSKERFDSVRPRDINLEVAIGEEEGEGTFFLFDVPSVWNTLDREAAISAGAKLQREPKTVPVSIRRLDSVLEEHLGEANLEVLSIDTEGHEMSVLRSNDFRKFRPRIILVEVHGITADNISSHETASHILQQGYVLYSWINPNLMFVRLDSTLA